jgi:hypothetical protein
MLQSRLLGQEGGLTRARPNSNRLFGFALVPRIGTAGGSEGHVLETGLTPPMIARLPRAGDDRLLQILSPINQHCFLTSGKRMEWEGQARAT